MSSYEFLTVNVFTARRFAGNSLAVLPNAAGLSDAEMQLIAAEFNFPETAFVLPPADPRHHARVRIFTPRAEIGFAGHPNVGTGYALGRRLTDPPEHFVFEEAAGLSRVHLLRDAAGAVTGARAVAPRALTIADALPIDLVAACASLPESAVATTTHTPLFASVGMEFAIAEITSVADLSRADPDLGAFRDAAARLDRADRLPLLLYSWTSTETRRLRARMFAPLLGVTEDPATGSGVAALAALLTSLAPGVGLALDYRIEQGIEIGRPSLIFAAANKEVEGPVTASIGGDCVAVTAGQIEV